MSISDSTSAERNRPAPRVLVIEHGEDCTPARVGPWLQEAGCRLDIVRGHRGDPIPDPLSDYAGLMVMGGAMGAYDDALHPWLTPTKERLTEGVRRGLPILGICLGHQLLAVATGGQVTRCPRGHQAGVFPLGLTHRGRADPVLADADRAPAVHWNSDIVSTPPADAEVLAYTPGGVQAMRIGSALGVQFHPEIGPEELRPWAMEDVAAGRITREAAERKLAEVAAVDADGMIAWAAMITRWASQLG